MNVWFKLFVVAMFTYFVLSSHPLSASDKLNPEKAAWQELVGKKNAFYEREPEGIDQKTFERFLVDSCQRAGELADAFLEFRTMYSESKHAKDAWDDWMEFLLIAAHRDKDRQKELERAEKECLANPQLTSDQRRVIRTNQIDRTSDLLECERMVRKFAQELNSSDSFFYSQMLGIAGAADPKQAQRLVSEILNREDPTQRYTSFRLQAQDIQKRLERLGKPVNLKFRSLQEEDINLADYRGKVVLIQFWATWCPPCVANIPKIKEVHDELHSSGFEVIGVSYDEDRKKLSDLVNDNAIRWPQFYSKHGITDPLIKSLGTPGPPAYWLVDQKGNLADIEIRGDLKTTVRKLLDTQKSR